MDLSLESLQLSDNDSEDPPEPNPSPQFQDYELIEIFEYYMKIINELEKTLLIWETQRNPDLDKDEWAKAEGRASGFRRRLTRTYMYPLRTEMRAITELKQSRDVHNQLLKILTRAYSIALAGLCALNAYSAALGNLPVVDKIKEYANDIKTLRQVSSDILAPVEKTVGNDPSVVENLCEKISNLRDIVYKHDPMKKRNMIPVIVKSNLDMYEPKLTSWATKAKFLAKLRNRKTTNRDSRVPNSPDKKLDVKPAVSKIYKKPVEVDKDVETAMDAYLPQIDSMPSIEKIEVPVTKIQPEKPKNVALVCVKSERSPVPEEVPAKSKTSRVLNIRPEILQDLFRFKAEIIEREHDTNEEVALISQVTDGIFNDMIEEAIDEFLDEDFLNQLIEQELTDMSNKQIT